MATDKKVHLDRPRTQRPHGKIDRKKFVEEYLKTNSPGKAAVAAGSNAKDPAQAGGYIMKQPAVAAMLAERRAEIARKLEVSSHKVLAEQASIAFSDITKLFNEQGRLLDMKDWPPEMRACVASVKTDELFVKNKNGEKEIIGAVREIKLWPKNDALHKLMMHLGLFERHQEQGAEWLKDFLTEINGIPTNRIAPAE